MQDKIVGQWKLSALQVPRWGIEPLVVNVDPAVASMALPKQM